MKIKSFYTTYSDYAETFNENKPICVFSGRPIFLQMMRCLLDGKSDNAPIDEVKGQTFVSRINFELDGEDIELCAVLCDDRRYFAGVKDGEYFSKKRTTAIISKLSTLKSDKKNSYNFLNKYAENDSLSECDYNIENFNRFIEIAKAGTQNGDTRPIYIFNFFERLDEAIDITPFIDALASLGRQVFVGISNNYPLKRFENDKVQLV